MRRKEIVPGNVYAYQHYGFAPNIRFPVVFLSQPNWSGIGPLRQEVPGSPAFKTPDVNENLPFPGTSVSERIGYPVVLGNSPAPDLPVLRALCRFTLEDFDHLTDRVLTVGCFTLVYNLKRVTGTWDLWEAQGYGH